MTAISVRHARFADDSVDHLTAPVVTVAEVGLDPGLVADFLEGRVDADALPAPAWGPIGREVYERTYSRHIYKTDPATGALAVDANGDLVPESSWNWPLPTDGRTNEVWAETVRRVVLGNLAFAPAETQETDEAGRLFDLIYRGKAIPAGRHLWVTGTVNPYSRNCFNGPWGARTSDHLRFLAARLFEGGGVGASYNNELLAKTQPIVGTVDLHIVVNTKHLDHDKVIDAGADSITDAELAELVEASTRLPGELRTTDDSREGWVEEWAHLVDLACTPGHHDLVINVSDVRPYGTPLATFGGQASGPAPLVKALRGINAVLRDAVGATLTSDAAMNIDHEAAQAVVAGGTRRSARMSLKSWSDHDIFSFITCKSDFSKHWSTNISVEVDQDFRVALAAGDPHAVAVMDAISVGIAKNGEPGIVDSTEMSFGENGKIVHTNPCAEIGLEQDEGDPENGIPAAGESCNIGSVNLDAFGTDMRGALDAFALMARFLYRATLNPYPDEAASRIERKNRRIGVGIMGMQGWAAAHGTRLTGIAGDSDLRSQLDYFRIAVRHAADRIADSLGLPRSIKVTAIAPTGSISQMFGNTPGIGSVYAKWLIRRVRYSDFDSKLPELAAKGYNIVDDIYAANTKVVEFPVRDAILDRFPVELIEQADEISLADFLALVSTVQNTFCAGTDGNAVSSTAQLAENPDPAKITAAIVPMLGKLKGLTAFPAISRPLSPLEALTEEQYDRMVADLDESAQFLARLGSDSNDGECATGACPVR